MAALPPFAQVIADMGGLGSVGSRRGVHVRSCCENLACEFHAFHYLRGNRIADAAGCISGRLPIISQRRPAMINPSLFLRRAIQADAIFSGVSALLLTFGAGELAPLLSCLRRCCAKPGCSWCLCRIGRLARHAGDRCRKCWWRSSYAGNAAWTIASIALLFSGAVTPNLLGRSVCRHPGRCGRRVGRAAIYRLAPERRRADGLSAAIAQRRHARPCAGHPRLCSPHQSTWMAGTSPAMTNHGGTSARSEASSPCPAMMEHGSEPTRVNGDRVTMPSTPSCPALCRASTSLLAAPRPIADDVC